MGNGEIQRLLISAQHRFCPEHATFQVNSGWTHVTAVPASCAVVRVEFCHFFYVLFVKCFFYVDGAQFVTANAQARTASDAVIGLYRGKLFSLGQFWLFLLCGWL